MAINVTFNGNTYSIPEDDETGWEELTEYLVALSNAATSTSIKFTSRISTTTPQTLQATDGILYMNVGSASTVNLPAGVRGQMYGVASVTANPVTIAPNGSETINGAASYSLRGNYSAVLLQFNGSGWVTIAEVNDLIAKSVRYDNSGTNASFVDSSITALNTFATAGDGESCSVDLTGSTAYELIVALDSGEALRLSTDYASSVINCLSDLSGIFLTSDAGTGIYVSKSATDNTITFKNRMGTSKVIEIKSLTCNLENQTAWA